MSTLSSIRPKIIRNKLLRRKVFDRDGGFCIDCGAYDPKWEHDHDVPLWSGGRDDLENSVTRCRHCHLRKTVGETPIRAKTDRIRSKHELTKKRRAVHKLRNIDSSSEDAIERAGR